MEMRTQKDRFHAKQFTILRHDESKLIVTLLMENKETSEIRECKIVAKYDEETEIKNAKFRSGGHSVAREVTKEFADELVSRLNNNTSFVLDEIIAEYNTININRAQEAHRLATNLYIHVEVKRGDLI